MQSLAWYGACGAVMALVDFRLAPEESADLPPALRGIFYLLIAVMWPVILSAWLLDAWHELVGRFWRWRARRALAVAQRELRAIEAMLSEPEYRELRARVQELEREVMARYG